MAVVCPECDNPLLVDVDEAEVGDTVQCDECGVDLEILALDPLEVKAADDSGYDDEETGTPVDEDDE